MAEIKLFAELGLEFIDLTMEPPGAASWTFDPVEVKMALEEHHMGVVGHTAYYLPIGNPFESLRLAAVDELKRCADKFVQIGATVMNVHPDRHAPFHDREFYIGQNTRSLADLLDHGNAMGLDIVLENIPGEFNTARQLSDLLDPLPNLGLHLDIGHCNLGHKENSTAEMVRCYGDRVRHAHLHDNNGGHADLHLPLGAGRMDWRKEVGHLKSSGYDRTITLEVFSNDKRYLKASAEALREFWAEESAVSRIKPD